MSKIFHHTPPLPAIAWPGGYAIRYLVVTDHRGYSWTACAECATRAKHEALQGPAEECEECGEELPSEYGEIEIAAS